MDLFATIPSDTRRVVLGASPLAISLGFYQVAIAVFLPLEGVSVTELGVILTTFGLSAVVFSIPFAVLSDRYGRRLLMVTGAFLTTIVMMVPGVTSDFLPLEFSAIVGGIGEAMYLSTWNAYLADTTSVDVRPAAYSLSFMTFTIASGVGSFLPGFFPFLPLDLNDAHRVTFVTLGLLGLATPLAALKWGTSMKPKSARQGMLPRKSLGIIMKFSIPNLMIALGAGLIIPLVPTWFYLRFNVTDVFTGPLLASASIVMGLAAVASPGIAGRIGLVRGIVSTQMLSTTFLFAIPLSPTAFVAAPLYVIRSALMNMSSPLADTFLMNLISEDERATASSFNVIIWRLPNAASTAVGGWLLGGGHLTLPFYLCTVFYVASIALFYAIFRGMDLPHSKSV